MTDVADTHAPVSENFLVKALEEQGVRVIGLGLPGSSNLFKAARALCRLIRRENISLIHTHLLWANVAGRLAGWWTGVPVISSFHNSEYDPQVIVPGRTKYWKQDLLRRLDGWTTRNFAAKSVAVSQYVSRHIQEFLGVKPADIEVIYNPIDPRQIQARSDDVRRKVFQELGLGPEESLILFVGRVTHQKGVVELVEAFSQVAEAHPGVHLAIMGDKNANAAYAREVCDCIARHGLERRIHMTGARRDVADWLAAADLFAFPTKYEGMGIALAEAMAAGLACVSTDVGPIPELIRHEQNGLLAPLGDVNALAAAIKRLLDDPALRQKLAAQARTDILKQLDVTDKSEEMTKLYRDIISVRRK